MLGEENGTAYRGDRGKTAYDHSQITGNPHGTTAADVGANRLPSYAAGRVGVFDPLRSVYNTTALNTLASRSWLGKARAGAALCRMAFLGDSSIAGSFSVGTVDPVSQLKPFLARAGFTLGELVWASQNHSGVFDARIVLAGTWNTPSNGLVTTTSNAATLTYTSQAAGTVVEILSLGTSATFTYTIDGGSPVSVTASGSVMRFTTVTGLANTTHTVVITGPSSGTTTIAAVGVRSASGIVLQNSGIYGATSAQLLGTNIATDPINVATATVPAIAFIEIGGNDAQVPVASATFQTNLTSIITKLRTAGADVHIILTQGSSTALLPSDYLAAYYAVADSFGISLLDMTDLLGIPAGDLMVDAFHLNASGHAIKSAAIADLLQLPRVYAAATKADIGLGSVDNTADTAKPVSTAQQTALNAKADDSAVVHNTGTETVAGVKTFSSSPVVPTPTTGTQAVNKTYADSLVAGGAPDATTSSKGIVQLAGDLGGTAASPTVPGLSGKAATSHTHAGADVTSGTIGTARLGSGTASSSTFLRGDQTWATPSGGGGASLTPTVVKTSAYSAAAGDLVPCDTATTGSFTVTLPSAPSDGTQVRVEHILQGGGGVVTVACGGSDVINRTGGPTSFTMPTLGQAATLQYKASGAIWYVLASDFELPQLDARYGYVPLASGESTIPNRALLIGNNASGNQTLRLAYFTAVKTEVTTQVRTMSATTAAGATPTLCRVGLYTIDGSEAGTLVASTTSDTSLWAAANTAYTKSWASSYLKVAGQRYAIGMLCVTGATAPTWLGTTAVGTAGTAELAIAPRLTGSITSQSDLPSTFANASVTSSAIGYYAALLP